MITGPEIAVYDENNTTVTSTWNLGKLKAQTISDIKTINIWNNKGHSTLVSDLKDAHITVLDYNGDTALDDVARDRWVQVCIPANGDDPSDDLNGWHRIGGTYTEELRGNSGTVDNTIYGEPNDGISTNSPKNVCTVLLRMYAPPNSNPGIKTFKIRISGYYT